MNAATLLDGDPLNNYLKRALDPVKYPSGAFNPEGALNDANNITIAGTYAYITTAHGLAVVSIADPLNPRIVRRIDNLKAPRSIAIPLRRARSRRVPLSPRHRRRSHSGTGWRTCLTRGRT